MIAVPVAIDAVCKQVVAIPFEHKETEIYSQGAAWRCSHDPFGHPQSDHSGRLSAPLTCCDATCRTCKQERFPTVQ